MTKLWDEFDVPRKTGESVRLRTPQQGTFWQLRDGLIVRMAAEETMQDALDEQRLLLALAVRDAVVQGRDAVVQ